MGFRATILNKIQTLSAQNQTKSFEKWRSRGVKKWDIKGTYIERGGSSGTKIIASCCTKKNRNNHKDV